MATFEKRVGKTGNTTWRVRVRRQSGPWLTKSFPKKSDAEQWARSIEHKLDSGDHVPNAEARKRTLADAIDRYLTITLPRSKHRKNSSEQTRLLTWWKEHLGGVALVSLTPAKLADARDALAAKRRRDGKALAGSTVNRYVTALSAVLSVAVKEYGWLPRNPVANVMRLEDSKGRERFLAKLEMLELLKACGPSDCRELLPIVELALATGAGKSELLNLLWNDVRVGGGQRVVTFRDTKNGETRTVPLSSSAEATLTQWASGRIAWQQGRVFQISKTELDKSWRVARDSAGLHDVRFHDLRHSAASYLAMSGASLMDIAAILGHKTLAMVKRYSHLSEQHTTAAIDRMAAKFLK
jgi:integrase